MDLEKTTLKEEELETLYKIKHSLHILASMEKIYQESVECQEYVGGEPLVEIDNAVSDIIKNEFEKYGLNYNLLDYCGGNGLHDAIYTVTEHIKRELKYEKRK